MRRPVAFPLAAVLGALSAFAVACGQDDSGLLSSGRAERLLSSLDRIERAVASGECDRAERALTELERRIDNLPGSTDRELRQRLQEGADRLASQVPADCAENRPETTTTETTETVPTDTVPTETVPTETTPTETVPTETVPTETTTTEPLPPETTPGGGTPAPEGAFVPGDEQGGWNGRSGDWEEDD